MRLRVLVAVSLLVGAPVSGAGCANEGEERIVAQGPGTGTNAAFTEKDVPDEVATSAFAADALSLGLSPEEIKAARFGQLRLDDFDGKPLVYLTFLAPESAGKATSTLGFLAGLPLDEAGQTSLSDGPWMVVVSGATTTASPRSLRTRSPALLFQIARALQAAGGVGQLTRLVAVAPTVFFAESKAGALVSVYDGSVATDEQATSLRALAKQGSDNAHSPEAMAYFAAAWESWMPLAAASAKEKETILAGLRTEGGQLDMVKLTDYLVSSGAAEGYAALAEDASFDEAAPGPTTQGADTGAKTCWGKGPFKVCRGGVETAYYDAADYASVTPHLEWPFEHVSDLSCSLPFVGGEKKGFGWEGCGPASFSTLMWRYWQKGTLFAANDCAPWNGELWNQEVDNGVLISVRDDGGRLLDKNAKHKGKVDSIRKVLGPLLARDYMYACSVDATNAATAPNFWPSGANGFFEDQGLDLQAKSNWSLSQVNALTKRDDFQSILNARVKKDGGATIGLISMDFLHFQGHYAPIFAYRIEKNPLGVIVGVDVGVDTFSGAGKINRKSTKGYLTPDYHSIIDPRNPLPSGLFWVEGSGKSLAGSKCAKQGPKKNGCDHDVYTQGAPLDIACNACTQKVCADQPYCCSLASATIKWDLPCVAAAKDLCPPAP
jgi:hypothetical protein